MVPAFTGLGAPYWDATARGAVVGMTLATGVEQLVTATLSSVVYQTQDLLRAMFADGATFDRLRVDGGMVVNDWLCQFLADIIECDVERPQVVETTALGAAMMAALGSGAFNDLQQVAKLWRLDNRFASTMAPDVRERLLAGWRDAVTRTRTRQE